jgi:hypothetical protein
MHVSKPLLIIIFQVEYIFDLELLDLRSEPDLKKTHILKALKIVENIP